jgi:hypothetical protein
VNLTSKVKHLLQKFLAVGGNLIDQIDPIDQTERTPKILLFVSMPQDLDMLLPLAIRLHNSVDYQVEIAVIDKAWKQSPRIGNLLSTAGIESYVVSHRAVVAESQPRLTDIRAVVTASESTVNAHKLAYSLTQKANRLGILTYTLQHGFENIGLNYFDQEYPVGDVLFASQTVFTWIEVDQLPVETPAETKQKCIAVGCPKFIQAPDAHLGRNGHKTQLKIPGHTAHKRLVVVFENLHWSRYSDNYRQRFLQDLDQTALACPDITFLVKPHHTGLWLTHRYQGELPVASNLVIADPKASKWEAFTAPALIEMADAVITTPSTVAIDAVRAGCLVAVVAYDLDLSNFEPLPMLRNAADWEQLCIQAHRPNDAAVKLLEAFAQDRLVPGDAVQKIVDRLTQDLNRQL